MIDDLHNEALIQKMEDEQRGRYGQRCGRNHKTMQTVQAHKAIVGTEARQKERGRILVLLQGMPQGRNGGLAEEESRSPS